MERRLAAILAADVVGYSRLMGQDEAGTLALLKRYRKTLFDPKTAEHHGRLVKLMGDGALVEFPSAVDAVQCAVEIQRAMAHAAGEFDHPRFSLRIGINLGDVIVEGDDLYGDGVNIAARLEGLAVPGSICISSDVYRQVRGKLDVGFEDLGEQTIKNIAEPVRVYRVVLDPADQGNHTDSPSYLPASPLDRPAVAVLPFTNMSGDPEQAYFADGVTEDIITALSYWRCFPVIARNSTFTYKSRAVDVTQAAKDLGARYVLEGSVRKAGNRVRISAQLIDATTAHHLWAERYDRDLGDIFDLQDEITKSIVASIEPQLSRAEQQRALRKRPENLDAWDCSLRALWHIHKATMRDYGEAERLLQRAIARDPTSSYAHSLLALRHFLSALSGWTADPPRVLAGTLQAAQEAVALDDDDWLPHALLGIAVLWTKRQYEQAIAEEERAIALNPSAVIAYQFLGCVLEFAGRPTEAIPHLETVLRLDPRYQSRSLILADLALCHLLLGNLEDAVEFARKAVEQQPGNVRAHQRLAAALGHVGPPEQARAALDRLLQLQPDLSLGYIDATYPFKNPGHREILTNGLWKAGWGEAGPTRASGEGGSVLLTH